MKVGLKCHFPRLGIDFNENWRRRRDSNPRYGNPPYGGLANRWFQPLTHVSGCGRAAAYIRAVHKLQPEESLRGDIEPHIEVHRLARIEHPKP